LGTAAWRASFWRRDKEEVDMLKCLTVAAAMLSAPALAQTAPAEPAPPSDNRAAILDDAATTPRAGETDVGATRAPDYRPAGMGGPYTAPKAYPPCTRTRTDNCRQRGGR
jgi:hypothetical protein